MSDPERCKEPVEWVSSLMDMRDRYERIITACFGADKGFVVALNGAFEAFINLNGRAPEFLSLYVDDRLRKGLKGGSEDDAEATLDKVRRGGWAALSGLGRHPLLFSADGAEATLDKVRRGGRALQHTHAEEAKRRGTLCTHTP